MVTQPAENRARVLDGAPVAEEIKRKVAAEVTAWREQYDTVPCLAVVRVGADPASAVYVRNKVKTSLELGLRSEHHTRPAETTTEELLSLVAELNQRADVDGILVQLPLPPQIAAQRVLEAIDPAKDVDGFHPINAGRLALGQKALTPCTPAGIITLLDYYEIPLRGARACVVGRSNIVGRPMAQLLLQRDATVTIAHSRTKDLPAVAREADILIAAIGRAGFIRAEHVKPGATVIDVGMNQVTDAAQAREFFSEPALTKRLKTLAQRGATLIGDVHPAEVERVAGALTPVPGGVGLLTVAQLMRNTMDAALARQRNAK